MEFECKTPSQCGAGNDCSPCYQAHIDKLNTQLQASEKREKELVEALEEVVYVLGDDPNNREWEVRLVKHARKALTGSKPIQGEK